MVGFGNGVEFADCAVCSWRGGCVELAIAKHSWRLWIAIAGSYQGSVGLLLVPRRGEILPEPSGEVQQHGVPHQHAAGAAAGERRARHLCARPEELPDSVRHNEVREAGRIPRDVHAEVGLHQRLPRAVLPGSLGGAAPEAQAVVLRPGEAQRPQIFARLSHGNREVDGALGGRVGEGREGESVGGSASVWN